MKKLAIDIGGTTVKGALFEEGGIVREGSVPTRGREGREAILSSLFSLIERLKEDAVLIGVSSAGNIDPAEGKCVYATENLRGWTGIELKKILEERYKLPCRVDNDAVCALKGELSLHPGVRNATMLTFGTGVGGASLVGGEILRGKRFDAARWGHITLVPNGRRCSCGRSGCAESYLSATALLARGREKIPSLESCKELFMMAAADHEEALDTLSEFGFYLNLLLDDIRTALAPELILLGGGVAQSREIFIELIKDKTDVAFAQLGNRAGLYGALI